MMFDGFARHLSGGEPTTPPVGTGLESVPAPASSGGGKNVKIGLVLGGGAARGWSHVGVLRVLDEAGIVPQVVAGCSIGAVIGGCYAAGKLDQVEAFARSLSKRRIMGLLDFHFTGSGLIGGDRLRRLLDLDLAGLRVETLPIRFASVATELGTGHEIWLTRGLLTETLRASYALPGVFDPVRLGGRWLMDGALVNPVPVTVARAFGADLVICVNVNAEIRLRGTVIQSDLEDNAPAEQAGSGQGWRFFPFREGAVRRRNGAPGIAAVMTDAFNITQDRISRSRLAGDPPDVMVAPKVSQIGLFEFHRAAECIELGRQAALRALPDIREILAGAIDRKAAA